MLAALKPLWALIFGIAGVACLGIVIAIVMRGRKAGVVGVEGEDEPDLYDEDEEAEGEEKRKKK